MGRRAPCTCVALGIVVAALAGCPKADKAPGDVVASKASKAEPAKAEPAKAEPAKAPKPGIQEGETAPDFDVKDDGGTAVKLSQHRGEKAVLLAFYPKDFTGG